MLAIAVLAIVVSACSSSSSPGRAGPSATTVAPTRHPAVALARVSGPVTGGDPDLPVNAAPPSLLARYGYSEHEYFVAGTATAYRAVGTWGEDGHWASAPSSQAPYKTRLLVRLPQDAKRFNGTVVVEWYNETSGRDADPDFGFAGAALMQEGYGYVGVSAQRLGVTGESGFTLPIPDYHPLPLVTQNPGRYGHVGLAHPGDDYAYDIFSQAAETLWHPNGINPLGAVHPRHVIADGQSQSASYLVTYANAIEPMTHEFDGIVIHSRGDSGTGLARTSGATRPPPVAHVRTDGPEPIMVLETETDLFGLGYAKARQPDDAHLRVWEMAGTAHADQRTLDYGVESGHLWSPHEAVPPFDQFCGRLNDGPEALLVSDAFSVFGRWVAGGAPPVHATPMQVSGQAIARDAHGNALGGVRSAAVDVPVATLTGAATPGAPIICSLFGHTIPFAAATLATLYPTHAAYVTKVKTATDAAVRAGFVRAADRAAVVADAEAAKVPS